MTVKSYIVALAIISVLVTYPLINSQSDGIGVQLRQTSFINQDRQHEIPIDIETNGLDISLNRVDCSIGGSLTSCFCRATDCTKEGNKYSCKLVLSPIDYMKSDAVDVFDPSSRRLTLTNNKVTITYHVDDDIKKQTIPLDDITVTVVPVCGNGMCERTVVGEKASTCCLDCDCPTGQTCFAGNKANGECVFTTSKDFFVSSTNPSKATAIPFPLANQWYFTSPMEATLTFNILKDFQLSEVWMRVFDTDYKLNCSNMHSESIGGTDANIVTCPFLLPPFESGASDPTEIETKFFATISFEEDGVKQTQGLETTHRIGLILEEHTVQGCKEKIEFLETNLELLQGNIDSIDRTCTEWASEERQEQLETAVEECCEDTSNTDECQCGGTDNPKEDERGSNSPPSSKDYVGQDHSCYLCAKSCLCDTKEHFDNLVKTYESYKDNIEAICSSTNIDEISEATSSIRDDVKLVEDSMNAIKNACSPTTKKSDKCSKDDFPECSLESGLEKHTSTQIEVASSFK